MQLSNFGNLEGKELAFLKIDYLYWDFLRSTYNIEEPFLYSVFLAFFSYWYEHNSRKIISLKKLHEKAKLYINLKELNFNGIIDYKKADLLNIDKYRKEENWKLLNLEHSNQYAYEFKKMSHLKIDEIMQGTGNVFKKSKIYLHLEELKNLGFLKVYSNLIKDSTKNSYLYNPEPYTKYIFERSGMKFDLESNLDEKEFVERLELKGYTIIPPEQKDTPAGAASIAEVSEEVKELWNRTCNTILESKESTPLKTITAIAKDKCSIVKYENSVLFITIDKPFYKAINGPAGTKIKETFKSLTNNECSLEIIKKDK